ncbi:hypothetical protein QBC38DRAFT_473473 [Podospora fimiseda]|uniref:SnoaL-like domain-containing protein n=1 Tax=Podospora fimiseda TaxID=252190 RepID=A0AAN7BSX1_9PEZI|nr:hypothetical protein QBC38DRAFT_473473 [Podospora fimiseda]
MAAAISGYDTAQYLLDRANIHDTLSKIPLFYDYHDTTGLLNEVYAPEITIDYSSLLGGEPFTVDRKEWIGRMIKVFEGFSKAQHFITGIVTDLPQPGGVDTQRPTTVTVKGETGASLVSLPSEDGTTTISQNGGLVEARLQFFSDLEAKSLNPWRVTYYKVIKTWDKGDAAILKESGKHVK